MRPVIAACGLLGLVLGCSTQVDVPCCPRGTDGGCVVLAPAAPGSSNRRLIQFSSPECAAQICVTELVPVDGGPPQGYCSVSCSAVDACPGASTGAMRCDSTIPTSDGGSVSVCVRPAVGAGP